MSLTLRNGGLQNVPPNPPRRQRLRISNACHACRLRKVKCDGTRSACDRKSAKGGNCTSDRILVQISAGPQLRRTHRVAHTALDNSHASSHVSTAAPTIRHSPGIPLTPITDSATSVSGQCSRSQPSEEGADPDRAYYTAHGRFAGEVAAAIDVRAGIAPAATSNLVPFVDAPLFGEMDLHAPHRVLNFAAELPPRSYADHLISIYWQHIDPVEPILDRRRFFEDYNASYSQPGTTLGSDHDIWLSILNIVFALAVQRQESISREKRDEEGNRYFQHAWALVRPETILWKPGSLELVQCLMLMNRYLHCTSNQQKTWMTAGLAIRIAQGICCHLSEASSSNSTSLDGKLKRKVWASCVALDRCVSWSLGRTSAPFLIPLPNRTGSNAPGSELEQADRGSDTITRGLELFEIGSQIQLAQTQTRNNMANRLGLPRLYQQDEYHAVAVQLESCLNIWENALPSDWKLTNLPKIGDRASRAERYLLHLRLYHSRIFLYRPLLARFYSLKTHASAQPGAPISSSPSPSLSDRLLKECAASCVETAEKITSLIVETLEPGDPIGLLPWWSRIYYLHIAGITFLAAMITSDLYTDSVHRSWTDAMAALRSHQHLSMYVQQCVKTFETLSARIMGPRRAKSDDDDGARDAGLEDEDGPCSLFMDHVMHDVGFDFNNFLFGTTEDFL